MSAKDSRNQHQEEKYITVKAQK